MAALTAPIKVDAETDALITNAAHYLQRSKKQIVDDAVREYINAHRAEIEAGVLQSVRTLDGSLSGAVSLLTGLSKDELDDLGGFAG